MSFEENKQKIITLLNVHEKVHIVALKESEGSGTLCCVETDIDVPPRVLTLEDSISFSRGQHNSRQIFILCVDIAPFAVRVKSRGETGDRNDDDDYALHSKQVPSKKLLELFKELEDDEFYFFYELVKDTIYFL